jgi:phage portal protein BeeE
MGVREWFSKRSSEGGSGKAEKAEATVSSSSKSFGTLLGSRSNPMLLSTVYRCVDLISDSVATLPLETYRIDGKGFKTLYVEHPVYDLLHLEPNDLMSRYTFLKGLVVSVLLTGNGYAYIERGSGGRVEQSLRIWCMCCCELLSIIATFEVGDNGG